jgi:hypothetical protein
MDKSRKSRPTGEETERAVRIICMLGNEIIRLILAWRGLR